MTRSVSPRGHGMEGVGPEAVLTPPFPVRPSGEDVADLRNPDPRRSSGLVDPGRIPRDLFP